jgi:heterotetrameric sarcosine oxidase gamma subunit
VTDAPITIARRAPDALLRLELWDRAPGLALPAPLRAAHTADGRLIWIEPDTVLLRAPLADLAPAQTRLEAAAGEAGAVIDITGGLARFTLTGPAWRELLTIGGVLDVEDPAFAPGCTAATVLHHAAVWIDVIGEHEADLYCLPSYAQELEESWARAIARMSAEQG